MATCQPSAEAPHRMLVHGSTALLRARRFPSGDTLLANNAGDFLLAPSSTTFTDTSSSDGRIDSALRRYGLTLDANDQFGHDAHAYRVWERRAFSPELDYLILIPTLRCNLSCSYCQVSRVNEGRAGFDWSEATLDAVLATLDSLPAHHIKIEFQGGEPTLRPDLIERVIERCARFARKEFVICSNLQSIDERILAIFDRPEVFISTSLDGDFATHGQNRTGLPERTRVFIDNLRMIADRYGPGKISALPTIDPHAPPDIDGLIDSYRAFGLESIFLRPINYQGFARKRHKASLAPETSWHAFHEAFVRRLIARNWADRSVVLEETYLSICLRRIFQPGRQRHVDLRNPNPMGIDYIVVDHDGLVYPTDEARMLARSGVIDLSIGTIADGWDGAPRDILNRHADNRGDPACDACVYQPYCGRDLVDDISRYGRIDLPRHETEFCRRHLRIFDLIFELIYSDDPATLYSLSRWLRLPGTLAALGSRVQ